MGWESNSTRQKSIALGVTWSHLDSPRVTLGPLGSLGVTQSHLWKHLESAGVTQSHLGSRGVTSSHRDSPCLLYTSDAADE